MRDKRRVKRGICKRCHTYGPTEFHHIFGGPKRKASERHDFVLELCQECHQHLHRHPGAALIYKQQCQREWEAAFSRAGWMNMMHKNYLEDE